MIELTEPNPPGLASGDPMPCHFFMPEVEWPAPLEPILRQDLPDYPRRDVWLKNPPARALTVGGAGAAPADPENLEAERSADIIVCLLSALSFLALMNVLPPKSSFMTALVIAGLVSSLALFASSLARIFK